MNVTEVLSASEQIGGGGGWVAGRIREAADQAQVALKAVSSDWSRKPSVGPHPREAALEAAREAVIHLNEALKVEAPEDAVIDTRHALEALATSIAQLEKLSTRLPVIPGDKPVAGFEKAIGLLIAAESKITHATWGWGRPIEGMTLAMVGAPIGDPNDPHIMGGPGLVPPAAPENPDLPRILDKLGLNPPTTSRDPGHSTLLGGPGSEPPTTPDDPDRSYLMGGVGAPVAPPGDDTPRILSDNGGIVPPWLEG